MKEHEGFWVFIEQIEGKISEVGLELLSKARELADQKGTYTAAILLGDFSKEDAKKLTHYGADKVFLFSDERLNRYCCLAYSRLITPLVEREKPEALFMGATPLGADLAPRVAAQLETGLSAHCVDLRLGEDGILEQIVPGFGGTMMAVIICPEKRPQMATVMPGVFKKSESHKKGEVIEEEVTLSGEDFIPEAVEYRTKKQKTVPLEGANVVVCGGYGMENEENWKLLEELASVLGGAVGATRPAVDEGWAPEEVMIGQSGKIVRPKLYIGAGISGVMHHVVGIQDSDIIVVINKDPGAQFFEVCDFGVVGDAEKILPALIEKLKERFSS
ncbi:MAG: electron transfer flavoprotein subunit alpha/FixB family protein [Deferribacteres bacterium]|nr:electron transfer flavoprotein subunit alpha/FixB family protein [Deferribacteres bacterium]